MGAKATVSFVDWLLAYLHYFSFPFDVFGSIRKQSECRSIFELDARSHVPVYVLISLWIPTHSKPMEVSWNEALQTFACLSVAFPLVIFYSAFFFFSLLSVPVYTFLWVLCWGSVRFERKRRCAQVIERTVEEKLEQKRLILILNQVMGAYVFGSSKLAEDIFWVSGGFWGSWNGFWGAFKV